MRPFYWGENLARNLALPVAGAEVVNSLQGKADALSCDALPQYNHRSSVLGLEVILESHLPAK